jgi:nucleoid-associated protein YgaU
MNDLILKLAGRRRLLAACLGVAALAGALAGYFALQQRQAVQTLKPLTKQASLYVSTILDHETQNTGVTVGEYVANADAAIQELNKTAMAARSAMVSDVKLQAGAVEYIAEAQALLRDLARATRTQSMARAEAQSVEKSAAQLNAFATSEVRSMVLDQQIAALDEVTRRLKEAREGRESAASRLKRLAEFQPWVRRHFGDDAGIPEATMGPAIKFFFGDNGLPRADASAK